MSAEIDYSSQENGTIHNYRLLDGELIYKCSDSDLEFRIDLRRTGYAIKRTLRFHRYWYAGWAAVGFPVFTFGVIYLKDRVIALEGAGWFHLACLIAGIVLLVLYRKPIRAYEVRTSRGDLISIFDDPEQPEGAREFAEAVETYAIAEP